jgi:hypothetical protein
MKITEKEQRYLLHALRWQLEDIHREIKSTQGMLNDGSWTPEDRAALEQGLKDAVAIEYEHQDLVNRIRQEI